MLDFHRYAIDIAHEIKDKIYQKTSLTCSAGISYCKFLAKIASDLRKPDGVTIIKPPQAIAFIEKLEIQKFFGIGKMTARKMQAHGIHTGADLKKYSKLELAQRYGKSGIFYYDIVRGIDDRPVKAMRKRKSLAVERTLSENVSGLENLIPIMDMICDKFIERLDKAENHGRTITMKIKHADFSNFTRGTTRDYFIKDPKEIRAIAYLLLEDNIESMGPVRLMGLSASNLEKEQEDKKGGQLEIDF
jgi:DNA polymerase-4